MKRYVVTMSTIFVLGLLLFFSLSCCCPPALLDQSHSETTAMQPAAATAPATTAQPNTDTSTATDFSWGNDIQAGLQAAKNEGKPILLDFWGGT